jgi:hypothetical protein
MAPLYDRPYCFSHDPERAAEAAEARRLGGLRRKKEGTIAVAYDLPGLDSVAGIRRLLEIVVTDGVGLENGVARLRVLIATAGAATNLLKVGELEDRVPISRQPWPVTPWRRVTTTSSCRDRRTSARQCRGSAHADAARPRLAR